MIDGKRLLPARRILAAALSLALIGVVSPAWAQSSDDDDSSSDKQDVRVYRMGHDDLDQGSWAKKDDDDNEPGDRDDQDEQEENDDQGMRTHVYHYKLERADEKGGYLGVRVQDISRALMKARDLASRDGALVNRVEDKSPADEAGIERGDVIVEVNREPIRDSQDLIETMQGIKAGSKIDVLVVREGRRKTLRVEVAKRPTDVMMVAPGMRWRSDGGMDPQQMKEMRARLKELDPEQMGQMMRMMPGPEVRRQLDDLRKELDDLKVELRDLKQQLRESRANSRGGRSGN
jgi:C-terminal processing protease CtpA/Prc